MLTLRTKSDRFHNSKFLAFWKCGECCQHPLPIPIALTAHVFSAGFLSKVSENQLAHPAQRVEGNVGELVCPGESFIQWWMGCSLAPPTGLPSGMLSPFSQRPLVERAPVAPTVNCLLMHAALTPFIFPAPCAMPLPVHPRISSQIN